MEVTLSRLLTGKPTIIKGKEYLSTKEYVTPFLNEMKKFTDNFIIHVQEPDQIIIKEDNEENDTTFNRVWIQAIMPEKCRINGMDEVYNFVYGLDLRTPIFKVYRSYLTQEGNPCVFNPKWIIVGEIEPEKALPEFNIKSLMEMHNDVPILSDNLKKSFIDDMERHKILGEMIEKAMLFEYNHTGGKVKLSSAMVVKAYENVYMNTSSNTYMKDQESSVWNFYQAFTGLVKDGSTKDIINNFEKTILCGQLFHKTLENDHN